MLRDKQTLFKNILYNNTEGENVINLNMMCSVSSENLKFYFERDKDTHDNLYLHLQCFHSEMKLVNLQILFITSDHVTSVQS